MVGQRSLGLAGVLGVGDLALRQPLQEQLHRGLGQPERGADRGGRGDRQQRRTVDRGLVRGQALALQDHRQRHHPLGRDEQVLRDGGDAAGAAQRGGLPVVHDGQLGAGHHRHDRHRLGVRGRPGPPGSPASGCAGRRW